MTFIVETIAFIRRCGWLAGMLCDPPRPVNGGRGRAGIRKKRA